MSKIEWTEATWNPVTGCTKCSPGCDNCYALAMSRRQAGMGREQYEGIVDKNGWTGKIKCNTKALDIPLKRKKPTVYFVCSMSDTFHPNVPLPFFDVIWNVMMQVPRCLLYTSPSPRD